VLPVTFDRLIGSGDLMQPLIFPLSLSMHCKGKYTALIAVLVVGSFIIPMAQYFWYVKDDDSSDKFFAKAAEPEPEPPKKKGGWFGGGKI
jgi:hypothetical protein